VADAYIANVNYDTSFSGQRKIVKLTNGWLIAMVTEINAKLRFYKSTDNGLTWTYIAYRTLTSGNTYITSMTSYGTTVCFSLCITTGTALGITKFDAAGTIPPDLVTAEVIVDSSQTAFGNHCNIVANPSNNYLYAVWVSQNASYPNSWNTRFSKSLDGGVTWSAVTQLTTLNTAGYAYIKPSITLTSAGNPVVVLYVQESTTTYFIRSFTYNGSAWNSVVTVYSAGTYTQDGPSIVTDASGVIHAVWAGLDSTDTTKLNIRYSKSTDNGATWSAATKLTSGNTYDQMTPSISYNGGGDISIVFSGNTAGYTPRNIKSIKYTGGSWGSVVQLTNECGASNLADPSSLAYYGASTEPILLYADATSATTRFFMASTTYTATVTMNSLTYSSLAWTISAPVGGSLTACRLKINGTLKQTYTTNLLSQLTYVIAIGDLNVGSNTVTIEVDVASTLAKTKYLTAAKTATSWNVDETTFNVSGYLSIVAANANESYVSMTETNTGLTATTGENQLLAAPGTNAKITQKLTFTRNSTSVDKGVTKITGALG
jgi:hypothetical protein